MTKKYLNRYRVESARAQWWDYTNDGAYFVTINSHHRKTHFGKIQNGRMLLSPLGAIADVLWHEIPKHAPHCDLGAFVVMPEHLHGILILGQPAPDLNLSRASTADLPGQNRYQNIGKGSLSAIIGSYKAAVTKHANRLGLKHGWQTRYHDHIIRNPDEYRRIHDYIVNNPKNYNRPGLL